MLTGALPFSASDPMEWVHCHIARQPVPPSERLENVPAPLSAIIMKLLAKTPEERYQTAAGLEGDLRRCLADWDHQGRIDSFPLHETTYLTGCWFQRSFTDGRARSRHCSPPSIAS